MKAGEYCNQVCQISSEFILLFFKRNQKFPVISVLHNFSPLTIIRFD